MPQGVANASRDSSRQTQQHHAVRVLQESISPPLELRSASCAKLVNTLEAGVRRDVLIALLVNLLNHQAPALVRCARQENLSHHQCQVHAPNVSRGIFPAARAGVTAQHVLLANLVLVEPLPARAARLVIFNHRRLHHNVKNALLGTSVRMLVRLNARYAQLAVMLESQA